MKAVLPKRLLVLFCLLAIFQLVLLFGSSEYSSSDSSLEEDVSATQVPSEEHHLEITDDVLEPPSPSAIKSFLTSGPVMAILGTTCVLGVAYYAYQRYLLYHFGVDFKNLYQK